MSTPILVKVIFSKHMDKKNKKIKFSKISLIQKKDAYDGQNLLKSQKH